MCPPPPPFFPPPLRPPQVLTVTNNSQQMNGVHKPMALRAKLGYETGGSPVSGMHTLTGFPAGL
jgi:hypothetical protein